MEGTTDFQGKQTLDGTTLAGGVKRRNARGVAITLWIIGFILLLVAAVIVRLHPTPWPFDLQTTITLQQLQPQLSSWVSTPIVWASLVDDQINSVLAMLSAFFVLSLIGDFIWYRGGSPLRWFVAAIFIFAGTGVMAGLDAIIGFIAGRPRPSPLLIHVFMPEPVASFPSGHVENDVVFYGFLLYLSLSKPVSAWRYRWILIPLQLYAVLNILVIGYSRVVEGSHWLTDALGGYLAGALWLVLLIFLYRWTLDRLTKRRAMSMLEQSTQAQQA